MDQALTKNFHLNSVSKVLLGSLIALFFCFTFIDIQPLLNHVSNNSDYNRSLFWPLLRTRGGNRDNNGCDLLDGSWVYDESNYPLYRSLDCPFIDEGFQCQENGRPDKDYMKWRWQPSRCNLPRFNARRVLELLRGKRVVFVGDSIGRNQWESMLCMLTGGMQSERERERVHEVNGEPITKRKGFLAFRFPDHDNLTVEYYRSPYIVPRGSPPPGSPPNVSSTLKLDTMDWFSPKYVTADFLVFNTDHWWTPQMIMQDGCYFQMGGRANVTIDIEDAFKVALRTWRKWVATELDIDKTKVFFRTYAPTHFRGGTWNTGGRCDDESQPSLTRPKPTIEHWTKKHIVLETKHLQGMGVQLFDITEMTSYRKDAHCSIYNNRTKDPLRMRIQDCSHWCLPGVPDAWNEILFAMLFS